MSQLLGLVEAGFNYDVGKMTLSERNSITKLINKQREQENDIPK